MPEPFTVTRIAPLTTPLRTPLPTPVSCSVGVFVHKSTLTLPPSVSVLPAVAFSMIPPFVFFG